jgi:hypothetical protein
MRLGKLVDINCKIRSTQKTLRKLSVAPETTYAKVLTANPKALKRLRKALIASGAVYVSLPVAFGPVARQILPKAELPTSGNRFIWK